MFVWVGRSFEVRHAHVKESLSRIFTLSRPSAFSRDPEVGSELSGLRERRRIAGVFAASGKLGTLKGGEIERGVIGSVPLQPRLPGEVLNWLKRGLCSRMFIFFVFTINKTNK